MITAGLVIGLDVNKMLWKSVLQSIIYFQWHVALQLSYEMGCDTNLQRVSFKLEAECQCNAAFLSADRNELPTSQASTCV